jgi:ABC-type nitrate/sulfonate/bicarbonate transport system substrate-binding protein
LPDRNAAQLTRRSLATLGGALVAGALTGATAPHAWASGERVLLPDDQNLQWLLFWVALDTLGLEVITPPHRRLAIERFTNAAAPLAILPAPMAFALVGDGVPLSIVANLMANDPINLVVSSEAAKRLPPLTAPVSGRLKALRGLRIGVASGPKKRLAAMLGAVDMVLDDVAVVEIGGRRQNAALGAGEVDALYAHSPYLERALVDQGAQLFIHQSAGEVEALTDLMVHSVVARRDVVEQQPELVGRVVDSLVHVASGLTATAAKRAIMGRFGERGRAQLDRVTALYLPALPRSLRPTERAARRTHVLFPSLHRRELDPAALSAVLDDRFVRAAERRWWRTAIPASAIALGAFGGWMLRRRGL